MPFRLPRRIWIALALVLTALAAYLVLLPVVASTRVVKERVAFELSVWSGYKVELDADPSIKLFPFRAVMSGVQLKEWTREGPPVLTADQVIIELSPIAALFNDVSFSGIRIMKPILHVERTAQGLYLPRLPGGGRMANAVKDAQLLTITSASDADADALPGDPLGKVEFSDARVIDLADESEILTSGNGILSWPSLDQPGSLSVSGIWRGEKIGLDVSSENPMLLLAGGRSQFEFNFSAPTGYVTFNGSAKFSDTPYFDGEASITTTSLKRLIEWSRMEIGQAPAVEAVSMRGTIQADVRRIKLDGLSLTLDGNSGSGVVEILLDHPRYAVSGTLDFETINLNAFLPAFDPIAGSRSVRDNGPDPRLTQRLDLDLRLSARQTAVGPVQLGDLAGTAQIRENFAVFDISDAQAFGGRIQAGMRFNHTATGSNVDINLKASDVDGGQLGKATGLTRVIPQSRGSISLALKGPVDRWNTFMNRLDGNVAASFGAGPISTFDLSLFRTQIAEGKVFPLSSVSNGTTSVDAFRLNGTIGNNFATLRDSSIRSGDNLIQLRGSASFEGKGLDLSGVISGVQAGASAIPSVYFLVGGNWDEPYISPTQPAVIPD